MDIKTTSMSMPALSASSLQPGNKPAVEVPKQQQTPPIVTTAQKASALEQVTQVNSKLEQLGMGVAFSIDEGTQSPVLKVIDRVTNEVIKQYPNEGSLEMMKNIQSYLESVQKGGMADKEGLTGSLISEII